jgi:acetyl-CoA carboxylase biotin carboxyl carrier protein
MTLDEIQDLIKFIAKSGVSEVEVESKDFKITIKTPPRKRKGMMVIEDDEELIIQPPTPVQVVAAVPAVSLPVAPVSQDHNEADPVSTTPKESSENADAEAESINAPMIGTFYRASSPDKPPFVNVGDEIKKGDVICIIEAMKLFNEIEAEVSGKLVKVLVDDATPVEYDQPIFLVEPY